MLNHNRRIHISCRLKTNKSYHFSMLTKKKVNFLLKAITQVTTNQCCFWFIFSSGFSYQNHYWIFWRILSSDDKTEREKVVSIPLSQIHGQQHRLKLFHTVQAVSPRNIKLFWIKGQINPFYYILWVITSKEIKRRNKIVVILILKLLDKVTVTKYMGSN